MEKDNSNNPMDVSKKVKVICCGLCPEPTESFKSRIELYQHFEHQHGICQTFRANSLLAPKKVNATDMTLITQKQIQVDASRRIPIKITKSVEPVDNPTIITSKSHDNTKVSFINMSVPSSFENNLPQFQKPPESQNRFLDSSAQQRRCDNVTETILARNFAIASATMLNMRPPLTLVGVRNNPTPSLHYYPTYVDLNGGGARPSIYYPYNAHPLPNSQQNSLLTEHRPSLHLLHQNAGNQIDQPWRTNGNDGMDIVDKENVTTGKQIQINDFPIHPSHNDYCHENITVVNNPIEPF